MRKQLFTLLLRAGMRYKAAEDNFEEALYGLDYLRRTKGAVTAFLKGRTWYVGSKYYGWYSLFNAQTEEQANRHLTLRPISDQELFRYALKQLKTTKASLAATFRKERAWKKSNTK